MTRRGINWTRYLSYLLGLCLLIVSVQILAPTHATVLTLNRSTGLDTVGDNAGGIDNINSTDNVSTGATNQSLVTIENPVTHDQNVTVSLNDSRAWVLHTSQTSTRSSLLSPGTSDRFAVDVESSATTGTATYNITVVGPRGGYVFTQTRTVNITASDSSSTSTASPEFLDIRTVLTHNTTYYDLAVTTDGARLYTAAATTNVSSYYTTNMTRAWTYPNHSAAVRGVGIDTRAGTPHDVASASADTTAHHITAAGGQKTNYTAHTDGVLDAAFNGSAIYTASADATVKRFNESALDLLSSADWTNTAHTANVTTVAADANGSVYSGGADTNVTKMVASDGRTVWTFTGHAATVTDIAPTPRGSAVYTTSEDGTVRKLSRDGNEIWSYTLPTNATAIDRDADGSLYISGGDGRIRKLNTSGGLVWNYSVHDSAVSDVEVNESGTYLYIATDTGVVKKVAITTIASDPAATATAGFENERLITLTNNHSISQQVTLTLNSSYNWSLHGSDSTSTTLTLAGGETRTIAVDIHNTAGLGTADYTVDGPNVTRSYTVDLIGELGNESVPGGVLVYDKTNWNISLSSYSFYDIAGVDTTPYRLSVGTDSGDVVTLFPNGTTDWTYTGHGGAVTNLSFDPKHNRTHTASYDNSMASLNHTSTSADWTYGFKGGNSLARDIDVGRNGNSYVIQADTVHKIGPGGAQLASYQAPVTLASVTVTNSTNTVYTGSISGDLTKYDSSLNFIWVETKAGSNLVHPLTTNATNAYLGSSNSALKKVYPNNTTAWEYYDTAPSPVVDNAFGPGGTYYALTRSGNLQQLGTDGTQYENLTVSGPTGGFAINADTHTLYISYQNGTIRRAIISRLEDTTVNAVANGSADQRLVTLKNRDTTYKNATVSLDSGFNWTFNTTGTKTINVTVPARGTRTVTVDVADNTTLGFANVTITGPRGERTREVTVDTNANASILYQTNFSTAIGDEWRFNESDPQDGYVIRTSPEINQTVYHCNYVYSNRTLKNYSGTPSKLHISFEYNASVTPGDWYERASWEVWDGNKSIIYDGVISQEQGTNVSGSKDVEFKVNGETPKLVFKITPSGGCSNSDHGRTWLGIDNLTVKEK